MKRIGRAILVVLASLLSPGCGGPVASDPDTLSIWVTYNDAERAVFSDICQRFEKDYRERHGQAVSIRNHRVPFDGLLPKLRTVAAAGRTPDICRVDVAHVVSMAYGGAIIPLDTIEGFPYRDQDEIRREYVPAAVDSCLFSTPGQPVHLWGVPEQTNTVVLFYNTEHFREAAEKLTALGLDPNRPPKTWDEFLRYAEALTDPARKRFGFAMELSLWWTLPFLNTYGAPFLKTDPDGSQKCVLDDPRAVAALQFKVDLFRQPIEVNGVRTRREAGAWVSGAREHTAGFKGGDYSMILCGPWKLEEFLEAKVPFALAPVPAGPAGTSSTVGGNDMVVFRSCRNPRLARDFLLYLTSPGIQAEWATRLGQIPVRPAAFDKVDLRGREYMRVFFDQMLTARARPIIPYYDRLEDIVNLQIEEALKGKKTVSQALTAAREIIDRDVLTALR